jgi:hypothetical protein
VSFPRLMRPQRQALRTLRKGLDMLRRRKHGTTGQLALPHQNRHTDENLRVKLLRPSVQLPAGIHGWRGLYGFWAQWQGKASDPFAAGALQILARSVPAPVRLSQARDHKPSPSHLASPQIWVEDIYICISWCYRWGGRRCHLACASWIDAYRYRARSKARSGPPSETGALYHRTLVVWRLTARPLAVSYDRLGDH